MKENDQHSSEQPLESWKEIAAYLKRDVRTVIRWEKSEGLPVHRQMHQARSSVYAYPSELDSWKIERAPRLSAPLLVTPWRRATTAVGFALILLLALTTIASGPILTLSSASAQQFAGMVTRKVGAGADAGFLGTPSPDGSFISTVDSETGNLAIRELATGKKRLLTDQRPWSEGFAEFSRVSPDGKRVAYSWYKGGAFDLRLVEITGSEPQVLYSDKEVSYPEPADWSPDGTSILAWFSRADGTNQIVLVSAADGSVRTLKSLDWRRPGKISFAPDGRYIVYDFPPKMDSPNRDISILASDGNREIPLIEHPADDRLLGWAPDGKSILFASDRTGTVDAWIIQVAEGRPQGQPLIVKRDIGPIAPMGFTREGSFYYGVRLPRADPYMATLDPISGKVLAPPTRITEELLGSNTFADFSPDGEYLAYVLRGDEYPAALGSRTLRIRSIKAGEEREIPLKTLGNFGRARWSADGRFIFGVSHGAKQDGLYRVNVETGEVSLVAAIEWFKQNHHTLSVDAKKMYFVHNEPGKFSSLRERDLETAREDELYRVAQPSSVHILALAPDGRRLAFVVRDQSIPATLVNIMPAGGGESREVLNLKAPEPGILHAFAWTSDGRYLLIGRASGPPGSGGRTELWRLPAEGGKPEKLGLAMDWMSNLRVHPDGQRIGFSAGSQIFELWVMENFLPALKASQ